MLHKSLWIAVSLLLNSCGHGITTAYSSGVYTHGSTLAEQNRYHLLVSSHLQTGIYYQLPPSETPGPASQTSQASEETQATDMQGHAQTSQPLAPTDDTAPSTRPITFAKSSRSTPLNQKPLALGFSLQDQKGRTLNYQFPRNRITVLAFADREGSSQMEGWIRPLYTEFTDQIDIHGIADLSAVPRFARGIAQGIVSSLVKYPVMLDWEGHVSRSYQAEPGKTTLVLITPEGRIDERLSGIASPDKLERLFKRIRELLRS